MTDEIVLIYMVAYGPDDARFSGFGPRFRAELDPPFTALLVLGLNLLSLALCVVLDEGNSGRRVGHTVAPPNPIEEVATLKVNRVLPHHRDAVNPFFRVGLLGVFFRLLRRRGLRVFLCAAVSSRRNA